MAFDMDNTCQLVVFSDKAYNAIIRETFEWNPVETGGILLGHILDNGCWIVMEVLPPGYGEGREGDNVFHEHGYFEYNSRFVNYLSSSVAGQYNIPLELLGLWHRHPGSMDHFSGTDDGTNSTFAANNPYGAISGLVNVDPQFRLTMYYLPHDDNQNRISGRLNYQRVDVEVGSDLIPEEYFKLRYYTGDEKTLHPYAPQQSSFQRKFVRNDNTRTVTQNDFLVGGVKNDPIEQMGVNYQDTSNYSSRTLDNKDKISPITDMTSFLKAKKTYIIFALAFIAFVCSLLSIKSDIFKALRFFGADKSKPVLVEQKPKDIKEMTKEDADGVDANKEMPEVEGAKKAESTEESIENTNTGNNSNQTKSNTQ